MNRTIAVFLLVVITTSSTLGLDNEHWLKADSAIDRGIDFLRSHQQKDGSWSPQVGPAITAMILAVMLDQSDVSMADNAARRALAFVLSKRKPDGGIHDGFLQNYNTAISLSALARVKGNPTAAEAIPHAQQFLRGLQWSNQTDPHGQPVTAAHPYFGGAGYGKHGRPDLSNTQVMLQGLSDSGLSSDDPAFQRAVVFISRCQGTMGNNMFADEIVPDGGFIYATSINKDQIGVPQSMAEPEQEAGQQPRAVRLRTYGSMTYAGFKSFIYADLRRDDPRVRDAYGWIRRNYTVDHNPGMPEQRKLEGYFYTLMTMARALDAWGTTTIATPDGSRHDWANDIINKLVDLQRGDGSWLNQSSRWMEKDPNLVTAYALIALTHAIK